MGEVLLVREACPRREVALKIAKDKQLHYMRAIKHEAMIMGVLSIPTSFLYIASWILLSTVLYAHEKG